jgi:hypothetical protein
VSEKYIATNKSKFDAGVEVKLIDYLYTSPADSDNDVGLFEGVRNGNLVKEICSYKEFEVIVESSLE